MALMFSAPRCPWCSKQIPTALLKELGLMKAFLARKTFACPHCQQQIQLPERAEKLVSSGLFVAVIIAPLFYYWGWNAIDPKILFALGLAITITGLILQKLQKVETTAPAQPLNDDSDDSDETSNHG